METLITGMDVSGCYSELSLVFEKHSTYFKMQRRTMLITGSLSNVVVAFTIYVIKSSSIDLMKMHKILMYSNILFPALMSNMMCFIFVPYVVIPYPIICTVGPFGFGKESTLLYLVVTCWFILLGLLSIGYTIIVNYLTVCHIWTLNTLMFNKLKLVAVIVPIALLSIVSVVAPIILLNESTIPSLIVMDPRTADFFETFSALVVHVQGYIFETFILLLLLVYAAGSIACAFLIFRSAI